MAITIADNVIRLAAQNDSIDDWINIKQVRWENPTTIGHLMTLHDKDGNEIITMIAVTANEDIQENGPGWVHGVDLVDLDSGEAVLFVD